MTINRKVTGTAVSMPVGIGLGCVVSIILTIIGSAIAAKFISEEVIMESAIGYAVMIIILLATMAGSGIAVCKVKRRILQVSALAGFSYFLILLAATALFFGGQYQGMWATALLIAGGCGAVALMNSRDRKGMHSRKGRRVN